MKLNDITRLTGTEILNVDLNIVDASTVLELKHLLVLRKVLAFRNQILSPNELLQIMSKFGDIYCHTAERKYGNNIYIGLITSQDKKLAGAQMHIERFYNNNSPRLSSLMIMEFPSKGGDTLFCNTEQLYEDLSNDLKELLLDKNTNNYPVHFKHTVKNFNENNITSVKPVTMLNKHTGKNYLNLCYSFTKNIPNVDNMTFESLREKIMDPKYHCRVQWRPGTVVIWDNAGLQHQAIVDYYPEKRSGVRVLTKNISL
jgi:taurine dioxygenase